MADNVQAEANRIALQRAAAVRNARNKVWMPNAIGVDPKPFLEARARLHKDQNEVLNHAERLIKEPEGGFHYGWARLGQPITVQRISSGQYRYVHPNDVKSEMRAMFTNHKGVSGELVCFGSLVLIAIPPKAWAECYIEPEIEAVARLAAQEMSFQEQIETASGGAAAGTIEKVKETD